MVVHEKKKLVDSKLVQRQWLPEVQSLSVQSLYKSCGPTCTAWCSEIGSLTSLDACNSGASSDVREPISLHQAVKGAKLDSILFSRVSVGKKSIQKP